MYLRRLALLLLLPLAGCLDVESDVFVGEDETVTAETTMTLGRQLYDMLQMAGPQAEGICPAASEKVVGAESVACTTRDVTSIDEAIAEAEKARDQDDFLRDVQITRLDSETLRLVLPLDFETIEGRPAELTPDNPMYQMMVGGLEGAQIVVRFHALEVLESNGAVSPDRSSVEVVFPTVEVLRPSGSLPAAFTAVLKYRECGLLGC